MSRDDIAQMMQDTAGAHWGTEAHFQRFAALVAAEKDKEIMRLIGALESVIPFVATQAVGCHGDKCREAWCWSCNDEDDAQKAAEQGADAADKAQAVIHVIRARGEA